MSFSVGIVGLPNVGKSTLFKALTKKDVDIAAYPFTTLNPNYGIVLVPDERLKQLAKVIHPEKITPTAIEFVDIAGLVKGAHKGEGLGNQFLAHVRNCDAIVEVVRTFENREVEHVEGNINPERDVEVIKTELLMKDLETLENLIFKLERDKKGKENFFLKRESLLDRVKKAVSQGKLISEVNLNEAEQEELGQFQFLTTKPIIYVFNTDNHREIPNCGFPSLVMNLKLEKEISELSEKEAKDLDLSSHLDQLILNCYNALNLITFFTIAGGKETRAWTVKRCTPAPQAGERVHSDFKEKFIRAEIIPWHKLVTAEGWHKARELGWLKTVGKEHIIEDGDVIEFKI